MSWKAGLVDEPPLQVSHGVNEYHCHRDERNTAPRANWREAATFRAQLHEPPRGSNLCGARFISAMPIGSGRVLIVKRSAMYIDASGNCDLHRSLGKLD